MANNYHPARDWVAASTGAVKNIINRYNLELLGKPLEEQDREQIRKAIAYLNKALQVK